MKYFELQDTPELLYAPKLKNWYGKFDVRNIKLETYHKLPKRELFLIEESENTEFTDVVLFPFLLVSKKFREVIKMYRATCFFREIILLDQRSGKSELYFLPVLQESSSIQIVKKKFENGISVPDTTKVQGEEILINKHLFWIRDSFKRHTILSLDLVESLLRRDAFGIGIQEVALYGKIQ